MSSDSRTEDIDFSAGLIHVVLTWMFSLPPIAAVVGSIVFASVRTGGTARFNPGPNDAGVLLGILMLGHGYFTVAAVLSAAALTVRRVPAARRISAWVAAGLALGASAFIMSTTVW